MPITESSKPARLSLVHGAYPLHNLNLYPLVRKPWRYCQLFFYWSDVPRRTIDRWVWFRPSCDFLAPRVASHLENCQWPIMYWWLLYIFRSTIMESNISSHSVKMTLRPVMILLCFTFRFFGWNVCPDLPPEQQHSWSLQFRVCTVHCAVVSHTNTHMHDNTHTAWQGHWVCLPVCTCSCLWASGREKSGVWVANGAEAMLKDCFTLSFTSQTNNVELVWVLNMEEDIEIILNVLFYIVFNITGPYSAFFWLTLLSHCTWKDSLSELPVFPCLTLPSTIHPTHTHYRVNLNNDLMKKKSRY